MSEPSLTDILNPLYSVYSLHRSQIPTFAGCQRYQPTDTSDGACLAVYQPDPSLGAQQWTQRGKRILIAMYKDEGRPSQPFPLRAAPWTRLGSVLTFTFQNHFLNVGDEINVQNVNDQSLNTVVTSVTSTEFTVNTSSQGTTLGIALWSPVNPINFYEDYVVFRLLPSFKLIPVLDILNLVASIAPQSRQISLPTLAGTYQIQSQLVASNTILDEQGRAPVYTYNNNGSKVDRLQRFAPTDNAPLYITQPHIDQWNTVPFNSRLFVFDYYGYELNNNRMPFGTPLIVYNSVSATGFSRATINQTVLFNGSIFDEFGDPVIGVRSNNTLFTRKPVQPIRFDENNQFNQSG